MNKKTIRDVDVSGQRVFVRVDFNVPLDGEGNITDDTRIQGAMPTIRYLLEHGAALVLASHLGRPKSGPEPKFSLAPTARRLQELLPDNQVIMAADADHGMLRQAGGSGGLGQERSQRGTAPFERRKDVKRYADLFDQAAFPCQRTKIQHQRARGQRVVGGRHAGEAIGDVVGHV